MGADLLDLLVHTCTVVRGALLLAPSDPLNPQAGLMSGVDFDDPAALTIGLRCRLAPLSTKSQAELAQSNVAGTVISTHVLYMAFADAPETLQDLDASPHPAVSHRISDVYKADGALLAAGPFDIQNIANVGSENEVLTLLLKKVS